jgi:hypothetical protein
LRRSRYLECLQALQASAGHPEHKTTDWWRNAAYAIWLRGIAAILSQSGREEPATRLLGTAEALPQSRRVRPSAITQAADPSLIGALRQALGEEAFAAAWAEGGAMSVEQAVELALSVG